MSTMTETVYTAYALTSRGREEIECYGTVEEAVRDMLELWPEEAEEGFGSSDIAIEDNQGDPVVYMARSAGDPHIAHVFHLREIRTIESYLCKYEPAQGGSVRTIIKRLA